MTDYTTSSALARVVWAEPIEQIWQVLPGCSQSSPNWQVETNDDNALKPHIPSMRLSKITDLG